MKIKLLLPVLAAQLLWVPAEAYETPTMGWSSWNAYGHRINESIIKSQADAMVSKGLRDAGYIYVNIDDGAFGGRDENGNLKIHPTRFPNGLKPVVDYIHGKGLKAGTYSDAGYNTCASFWGGDTDGIGTGLCGHDSQDIDFFFKDLGFDFIKVDFCGGAPEHNTDKLDLPEEERYTAISEAIKATGRDDVRFNVCRWAYPGTWVENVATSWRISQDIYLGWESVKDIIGQSLYLSAYATEGRFNDMDMLEVGRGMSAEEDKTHFAMWCILSSPLLIGCDMNSISDESLALLTNRELIAVNQDELALQGYVIKHDNGTFVVAKDLEQRYGAKRAVAFYNPTDVKRVMNVSFYDADLSGKVKVRDLFEKRDAGEFEGEFEVEVPAHGTRIYTFEAENRLERHVYEAETAWISDYQEIENNQYVETGIYEYSSVASGGMLAGWLGRKDENDLRWRDVYSAAGGKYQATLAFISGEDRTVGVELNGEHLTDLRCNSGGWNNVGTVTFELNLKPGNNEVRLYSATAWMPNIDYLLIVKDGSLDYYVHLYETAVSKALKQDCSMLPPTLASYLDKVLAANSGDKTTGQEYQDASEAIYAAIGVVTQAKADYEKFTRWLGIARDNAAATVSCQSLVEFNNSVSAIEREMDALERPDGIDALCRSLIASMNRLFASADAVPADKMQWNVTSLVDNPDFDTDTHGWSGNAAWGSHVAEHWNKTFETMQTLTGLRNGFYTFELSALYRTGRNDGGSAYRSGSESIPAVICANDTEKKIQSLYAHRVSEVPELEEGLSGTHVLNGYVNSMYGACEAFSHGLYVNDAVAEVNDGTLKVGVKSTVRNDDCWCCFDNCRLYYHGTEKPASIDDVVRDTDAPADVYNLQGICLYRSLDSHRIASLPAGIYIINGKKVLVGR